MIDYLAQSEIPQSFLEWLRRADLADSFADPIRQMKNGGLFGLLAIALFLGALGLGISGRKMIGVALLVALLGAAAAWFGGYTGYSKAMDVIQSSTVQPKDADVQRGANEIAFLPAAGTLALLGVVAALVLTSLAHAILGGKKENTS